MTIFITLIITLDPNSKNSDIFLLSSFTIPTANPIIIENIISGNMLPLESRL